jgi:hypothetical protein
MHVHVALCLQVDIHGKQKFACQMDHMELLLRM